MKWLKALPILLLLVTPAVAQAKLVLLQTEKSAQQHCPSDQVVWANLPTHIYHLRGQRWYGVTKNGAFVCRKEADANGYRMTKNGQ